MADRMTDAEREAALIQLMAAHKTSLMRMAYMMLEDEALAEDAVQDAFIRAYTHLESFQGRASVKTWLTRILINACKDVRRSAWFRHRAQSIPIEKVPEKGEPDTYGDDTVLRAVMALAKRDREVILLRYYQQMSVPEIAQTLGIPAASATSRLRRAKERLKESLKGWHFDEE